MKTRRNSEIDVSSYTKSDLRDALSSMGERIAGAISDLRYSAYKAREEADYIEELWGKYDYEELARMRVITPRDLKVIEAAQMRLNPRRNGKRRSR